MPELPDITVYIERLDALLSGKPLERLRVASPFLVRSVEPPLSDFEGRVITGFQRVGKRIVWAFEGDLFLVLHLMVAGRLRYKPAGAKIPGRVGLAAFDVADGTVILTEASKKKRASLHAARGQAAVDAHDRGGVEVMELDRDAFAKVLTARNHTLKRALTDPRIFSGIGNAYSDEILFTAKLSPVTWTTRLDDDAITRLHSATLETLEAFTQRLRDEVGDGFPDKVTAFRPDMAVHGRYNQPCPRCKAPVQRIRYASNETNYCAGCQTGGKLLADRSLSRLLKGDWPKTLEQLDALKRR